MPPVLLLVNVSIVCMHVRKPPKNHRQGVKKTLRKLLDYAASCMVAWFQACVCVRFVYDLLYIYTDKLYLL